MASRTTSAAWQWFAGIGSPRLGLLLPEGSVIARTAAPMHAWEATDTEDERPPLLPFPWDGDTPIGGWNRALIERGRPKSKTASGGGGGCGTAFRLLCRSQAKGPLLCFSSKLSAKAFASHEQYRQKVWAGHTRQPTDRPLIAQLVCDGTPEETLAVGQQLVEHCDGLYLPTAQPGCNHLEELLNQNIPVVAGHHCLDSKTNAGLVKAGVSMLLADDMVPLLRGKDPVSSENLDLPIANLTSSLDLCRSSPSKGTQGHDGRVGAWDQWEQWDQWHHEHQHCHNHEHKPEQPSRPVPCRSSPRPRVHGAKLMAVGFELGDGTCFDRCQLLRHPRSQSLVCCVALCLQGNTFGTGSPGTQWAMFSFATPKP
eukprot:m.166477 g.166477  ORF g.166477 m.166477 type:complete len:369 (-) comp17753_c0_seq8:1552-2658(-)